jgi:hypothetical protein
MYYERMWKEVACSVEGACLYENCKSCFEQLPSDRLPFERIGLITRS